MKAKLFPILLLLISLFGCNDENLSPEAKVRGSYESVFRGSGSWGFGLYDFVNTFHLRADGGFYREGVTKDAESGDLLGYTNYASGTYTISDGVVSLYYDEFYSMGIADIDFIPKEELTTYEIEGYFEQYAVSENYKQLESICPSNANCGAPQVYTRID
ncbi:hypothetical protein [Algoriphagus sp. A40]|uniref:hypothetical protein n=1 Tax=Algoriphagus sp. A40 TaxID=1945863 RepID=UPI0009875221|nr:hypothetical protein [Algoriphagus sp. A40]OOG77476.1 hypothetical protein B0E43_05080 [Algoriphagus sp. A40]